MRYLIITIFACISYLSIFAQATNIVTQQREVKLDTNRVAYDEQGRELKYYQYSKLLNTGEYTLRSMGGNPGAPGAKLVLVKMPPELRGMMMESVKSGITIKTGALREGAILDVNPIKNVINGENFDGKAIILTFWNVECPPCTTNFETINEILKGVDANKLVSVAVTNDDDKAAAKKLQEKPLLVTHSITGGYKVSGAYGVYALPTYIITDKDHVIKFAARGSAPMLFPAFKETLKKVLEGN